MGPTKEQGKAVGIRHLNKRLGATIGTVVHKRKRIECKTWKKYGKQNYNTTIIKTLVSSSERIF